jgi:hypothetical protein
MVEQNKSPPEQPIDRWTPPVGVHLKFGQEGIEGWVYSSAPNAGAPVTDDDAKKLGIRNLPARSECSHSSSIRRGIRGPQN